MVVACTRRSFLLKIVLVLWKMAIFRIAPPGKIKSPAKSQREMGATEVLIFSLGHGCGILQRLWRFLMTHQMGTKWAVEGSIS